MKVKKLLIIGAIALIVIGCVLAAGCTSNTTTQQITSNDKIVGNWTFPYDNGEGITGIGIEVIKKDGTGFTVVTTEDGKRLLKYTPCTWKKNTDGTYTFTFKKENNVVNVVKMTYDSSKDTYTDKEKYNVIHKRLDPITGIWFREGTDVINGKTAKFTTICLPDGTGCHYISYDDGSTKVIDMKWEKNSNGSYSMVYADQFSDTYTLDENTGNLSSLKYSNSVRQKKFADSYYYLSILGPWYDSENNNMSLFNADGTGIINIGNESVNFTWTIPEFGKFKLHVLDGDSKGKDFVWTYDREKDTFTTSKNYTLVRPTENVNGLTITKFTTEPILGIWSGISATNTGNGNATTIVRPDGNGTVLITNADDGTAMVMKLTWKKNADGTYAFDFSNGSKRTFAVDSTGKTLKTDDGRTKTKQFLDTASEASIVGAWYCKERNHSAVFNGDGTGFYKKQGGISPFTWKKTDDGKVAVTYTGGYHSDNGSSLNGKTFVWTYNSSNGIFTDGDGNQFTPPTESIKDRITLK